MEKPESTLPEKQKKSAEQKKAERELEQKAADYMEMIHDLRLELAAEQTARLKAERALLKLTLERYGNE